MNLFNKLNENLKKSAHYFFIETKFGVWLMASMATLNAIEGIVHLVVAGIGTWGMFAEQVMDVRIWLPIVENIILGGFSLLTGWALGIKHDHHHHHHSEKVGEHS